MQKLNKSTYIYIYIYYIYIYICFVVLLLGLGSLQSRFTFLHIFLYIIFICTGMYRRYPPRAPESAGARLLAIGGLNQVFVEELSGAAVLVVS